MGLASNAAAQSVVTERLRIQGGYITEVRPAPAPRMNDLWFGAVPELGILWAKRNMLLNVTYQLTGAVHSLAGATEVANRLTLASQIDLSRRATLLLSAEAAQTSFSNLLVSRSPTENVVALFPAAGNRTLMARAFQGLGYELSPRMRLEQSTEAGVVTLLAPAPPLDTFIANESVAIERVWPSDAVGAELRATYANTQATPPVRDQQFVLLTAAPRWRHDWTRAISTTVTGGSTLLVSPDARTKPMVTRFGRASALYTHDLATTLELSVSTGVVPSPLTGQIFHSDQVRLQGFAPISQRARLFLAMSLGYVRGRFVDLTAAGIAPSFEAGLGDADLTWQPSPAGWAQLFARYQVMAQVGDMSALGLNPSFIRDLFLVGVQFASRPPSVATSAGAAPGEIVPRRFPQRVDRSDGASTTTRAPEAAREAPPSPAPTLPATGPGREPAGSIQAPPARTSEDEESD